MPNNSNCGCGTADNRYPNGTNVYNFACGAAGGGYVIGPTGVTGPAGATGATPPFIYAQPKIRKY